MGTVQLRVGFRCCWVALWDVMPLCWDMGYGSGGAQTIESSLPGDPTKTTPVMSLGELYSKSPKWCSSFAKPLPWKEYNFQEFMLEQRVEKRGMVLQGLSLTRLCQALIRMCIWNAYTSPERRALLLFLCIKLSRFRDSIVVELAFVPDASNSSVMVLPW